MTRIPCYDKEGNTIKSLTQWDKNQSVYIDDLENGSLPRVHFALGSNAKESKEYKDNVKFDGKKIKITIPNELLKTYAEMYLFLYYGDVESEEPLTTKYMVKIPITKKPQPDDYIYEDNVDYLSIYKLKLELSLILDNAANYAAESRANKESAETAAREAAGSAQEARNILSDVNSAGANQIQAIETAGAEQTDSAKAEIDAKGKQTLDSIPEDYTGLQTEVDGLKGDLVELQEAVFDTETDYVEVTDVITLSNRGLTKISDTSFTIENSTHNIIGCSVTEGEKIKIICSTYNFYLGFGYVWATTEDTPELWNSSNAIGMLSSNEHDYFCGNTEEQWKTYTLELTVPSGAKKIWVRRMVETPHIYKMTPVRTSKIPTKTSQLENDSGFIVYTPVQRVPVVCFNFDQTTLDDRYVILKEHGFTATFGDADETSTKTLIKNGFDICPYLGNHTLSNISDEAIQTLTNSIAEKKSRLESWGVYNPVMCLCSGHKWTYALEQALINNNYNTFHYVRCATQYDSNDIVTYTPANASPSDRFQYPIPIEQFTVEQIKSIIDDFIEKKNPLIMLMMHIFTDDGGSNISKSQFIEIVEYVKTLSDNGTVKVMNMRQYYEYYYPEQAREDDRTRIFSALTN